MPNEDMVRFEVALYVAPEHEDEFINIMNDESDICFLLDVERLAGAHLHTSKAEPLRVFRSEVSRGGFDYGMDVVEAAHEGNI